MLLQMLEQKIMRGVVFVTHDLPVLRLVSNRIAVMYAGQIIEIGQADELTDRPRHPYSAALLGSVLSPEPAYRQLRVYGIPGSPPNLANPPAGCRFHPRCGVVYDECHTEVPPHVGDELHFSKCFWAKKHPGESVPLKAVTAEDMSAVDSINGNPNSETHLGDLNGTGSSAADDSDDQTNRAGVTA
jgi:peptide/nickel transport system ATP-binding protein